MKDRDFLWCALNLMLDDEEELASLCPSCRSRTLEERCTACGAPLELTEGNINDSFDQSRFQALKRRKNK